MTVSTLYRWPASAHFGRVVPKTKFYEHGTITKAVRDKFVAEVQRITWAYKLADSTVHLRGSDAVPEIQVFVIDAKRNDVSNGVITAIDKTVRFPVIFEVRRNGGGNAGTRMVATPKRLTGAKPMLTGSFTTDWIPPERERTPLPTALDLPALYSALLGPMLPVESRAGEPFAETTLRVEELLKLDRKIATLERRLRTESQFNRKVELRRQLRECVAVLEALRYSDRPNADQQIRTEA
ncbi:DUF4391 domain-containing protein [Ilumatobacter sp.]|uniref:DUF4391 domain-containing protein n=1 Tax=Ilumatobacter sp. TaxID=1967498 RepID=UPI003B52D092